MLFVFFSQEGEVQEESLRRLYQLRKDSLGRCDTVIINGEAGKVICASLLCLLT